MFQQPLGSPGWIGSWDLQPSPCLSPLCSPVTRASSEQPFVVWSTQSFSLANWCGTPALPPWKTGSSGASAAIVCCH
ncbi:hypothetical protein E5288_WYG003363 [Bos mutus]|uniref:Uncharacterized protein n=1 Tax=Bos mutus TaxID=72004 RepID=A0A6B0RN16_9CETA|nr:hypothetical protein [Bos mutus]